MQKPTILGPSHCSAAGSSHHSRSSGPSFWVLRSTQQRTVLLRTSQGPSGLSFGCVRASAGPATAGKSRHTRPRIRYLWMALNSKQRVARRRAREQLRHQRIYNPGTPSKKQISANRRQASLPTPPSPGPSQPAISVGTTSSDTPVTRRPLPPLSSEHPRFLLRLRRRANARFTNVRRELFPEDREPKPKLAYPGNLEGHLPSHRSAKERNHAIRRFLDSLQTPSPLESPTFTCPNQAFYLQV